MRGFVRHIARGRNDFLRPLAQGIGWLISTQRGIPTEQQIFEAFGRNIVEAAERRRRQLGVEQLETVVVVGDAATQIVYVAQDRGMDLVALGRRGRGTMAELLSGSVSLKVFHIFRSPVPTVP